MAPKMGRQRNNPQSKGKEESPERVLNETEASSISDIEFKVMVIRVLKALSENYKGISGNYINMKNDIETMNKNQEEMKNTIPKMRNTLEGMKSRLDWAEDGISKLEDNIEQNTQSVQQNEKRLKKNKDSLRELRDNMKYNICNIRIPEGEEKEQGVENLFEKMTENFSALVNESHTSSGNKEGPNQDKPKEARSQTHSLGA